MLFVLNPTPRTIAAVYVSTTALLGLQAYSVVLLMLV